MVETIELDDRISHFIRGIAVESVIPDQVGAGRKRLSEQPFSRRAEHIECESAILTLGTVARIVLHPYPATGVPRQPFNGGQVAREGESPEPFDRVVLRDMLGIVRFTDCRRDPPWIYRHDDGPPVPGPVVQGIYPIDVEGWTVRMLECNLDKNEYCPQDTTYDTE